MDFRMTTLTLFATASIASADILIDEGFESYTGGAVSGWTREGDHDFSSVAGLDGTTAAVLLGSAGSDSSTALRNTFSSEGTITDTFTFAFDFQQLMTGNSSNSGDRIMNFTLRESGQSVVNWRVLWDGSANGTMQYYDGAWQNMATQNELINESDVYRVTLSGDLDASYSITVNNLTDSTVVGGQVGITGLQSGFTALNELRFERGRSAQDFIIDNVYLSNVPEPSAYALLAGLLALSWGMVRRRQ
ncbi:MAG TPA: hypothetical protein DEA90_14930 [Opitutae bacterium]|nr:hypothetical protein [Puniceicoccaceae bacterium]HBR95453.1 hypothetical protein [Opitutae bacterium]